MYISLVFSVQYVKGTTGNAHKQDNIICIYRYNVRLYTSYFLYHRLGNSNGGHENGSDCGVLYKSKIYFGY